MKVFQFVHISKYIKYSYKGAYQYFKIEIVDSYCPQTKNFDINQFELFGSIMFAQNDAITCNSNIIISKIIYTIIFKNELLSIQIETS